MQDARSTVRDGRGVLTETRAGAAGFEAEQLHALVFHERMEQPDRVRTTADARNRDVGQLPRRIEHLLARLAADDRLQLTHDVRIRMRADRRTEAVVRAVRIAHPVT